MYSNKRVEYQSMDELLALLPNPEPYRGVLTEYREKIVIAKGSGHNHQAWEGGYLNHVLEVMNIGYWLYTSSPRLFPFTLHEALEVLFWHDIEKPFAEGLKAAGKYSKADRKAFRAAIITDRKIDLTSEQWNALKYIEGVPDSEYTPGERTMGELAAFCHCCDILSARVWHDRGREGAWDERELWGV